MTPLGVFEIVHFESGGTDIVGSVDKTLGKVIDGPGPVNDYSFISFIISTAHSIGVEITQVVAGVVCGLQQDVPDWEDYEILD